MSGSYDFDLVCIGSGPAGPRAAVQAATLGKRAAIRTRSSSGATAAGSTFSAEHILIAVGTRPAEPPRVKADGEVILNTDDVVRLEQLPRALAVVGAAVIGIECSSIVAALGVAVTLVEKRDRPLEFLDHEIVDELLHQMRTRNTTFRFGEAVESIALIEGPPRTSATTAGCCAAADAVNAAECYKVAALDASNKLRF